jgi:glycine cleavage system H lipoate-binding protein
MTAPDFIEPLIGFRAWHLNGDGALVPWALSGAGAWEPGVNTAVCHAGKSHAPPAADCMCGLYALASSRDPRLHGLDGQIVGAVAAWGDIELHRTGFRAEHAAVVALAEPEGGHPAAPRAAARYDVPLVPRDELEITARRFGRPVDPSVFEEPAKAAAELHVGETGIALVEHVWCRSELHELVLGITRAFADRLLDERAEITLPPPMTRIEARDPLATIHMPSGTLIAWAGASGFLLERNERVLRDPTALLADPEGAGWLARLSPTAWPADARHFSWGEAGRTSYAAQLARAAAGEDVFADLRADRLFAGPRGTGMFDIVAELRRRRAEPRFRSDGDVYAVCAEPVRERIAGSQQLARLGAFDAVVRYSVREPDAEMTLAATPSGVTLTCGPTGAAPTVTLTMTAETAAKHFGGRLDIARALRAGIVTSDRPRVETLRTMALLKPLLGPARV